jgi:hypothetical protein
MRAARPSARWPAALCLPDPAAGPDTLDVPVTVRPTIRPAGQGKRLRPADAGRSGHGAWSACLTFSPAENRGSRVAFHARSQIVTGGRPLAGRNLGLAGLRAWRLSSQTEIRVPGPLLTPTRKSAAGQLAEQAHGILTAHTRPGEPAQRDENPRHADAHPAAWHRCVLDADPIPLTDGAHRRPHGGSRVATARQVTSEGSWQVHRWCIGGPRRVCRRAFGVSPEACDCQTEGARRRFTATDVVYGPWAAGAVPRSLQPGSGGGQPGWFRIATFSTYAEVLTPDHHLMKMHEKGIRAQLPGVVLADVRRQSAPGDRGSRRSAGVAGKLQPARSANPHCHGLPARCQPSGDPAMAANPAWRRPHSSALGERWSSARAGRAAHFEEHALVDGHPYWRCAGPAGDLPPHLRRDQGHASS